MSDRTPAGEKGTADRIAADDGGYWVRLVTKQALRREDVCMGNCLDSQGYGQGTAGDEEMVSDAIWSLRKADGVSYLTVEVDVQYRRTSASIDQAEGPMKSQPAAWSIRQLRHLVAAFRVAGCEMTVPDNFALTDADGMTYRPDRAPDHLRLLYEEDVRREMEERAAASRRLARELEEYRRRVSEGGESPISRMYRQMLDRMVIGVDTQVVRESGRVLIEPRLSLRSMQPRMLVIDEVDNISGWGDRIYTNSVRSGIEVDRSGAAVAYHVEPLIGRARGVGEPPVGPTPSLQDRLLTGFAHPAVRPGPRAREPPPLGTPVTMDDVRRARRYRGSAIGAIMLGSSLMRGMLFGDRNRAA